MDFIVYQMETSQLLVLILQEQQNSNTPGNIIHTSRQHFTIIFVYLHA